ncbi:excinuclease ABC subunit UvrA [Candidatus Fermentibacteria bacterium]|nr:excinuclease ABC subunit UvrA [Candidatus Fermentibacteria bacterium]
MNEIKVRGAREHNLKGIDVDIPKNRLVVLTGVSGSGKSSFAFDTLYAEGQRRYVESLSAYARQFLGQMEKPLYESIDGLSPSISIEQKKVSHNPRSTVGTVTEIADYLRVLYARVGQPHCPECGRTVSRQTAQQMVDRVMGMGEGKRLLITAPLVVNRKGTQTELLKTLRKKGYVRVMIDGGMVSLDEAGPLAKNRRHDVSLVVDRIEIKDGIASRLTDSIETALSESGGVVSIVDHDTSEHVLMSEENTCAYCGVSIPELSPQLFSFNSPLGMCQVCSGLGFEMSVDPDLVVPRPSISIADGAVVPWGQPRGWTANLVKGLARHYDFSPKAAWSSLGEDAKDAVLYGSGNAKIHFSWSSSSSSGNYEGSWEGVIPRLERLYRQTRSQGSRKNYEQYFRSDSCSECDGSRLRTEARAVTVGGVGIQDVSSMTVLEAREFFENLKLDSYRAEIAGELLGEITARLGFLVDVGLHYLTLDRPAPTLSGGEAQRIRLASQIGSGLTGVLYVLDEPTIGLHRRDNRRLIATLERLRDLGNTVLVVEHDRDTIESCNHVVDFGPGAGIHGGEIVAEGTPSEIAANENSLTGRYLAGDKRIRRIRLPREENLGSLTMHGATLHNLKGIDLRIPLKKLICVTGVSGSGKSSLISQTLYPALASKLGAKSSARPGPNQGFTGLANVDKVISISQDPIGRTPRSNPATYTKVFDHVRRLFANLTQSRVRGYKPGRFSFNVRGGRCEDCRGAGVKRIEMHFLPDVFVQCQTCKGRRFNRETLKVTYKNLNIAEVLDLTVEQAMELFERVPSIYRILKVMSDVGLGYIELGQQAPTLSGGEAQRVKLARELARPGSRHTMYILDEPTTGLHFHDVKKLLQVLDRLVRNGNTVVVIEHNLDVIKNADWIIDLGPEGGYDGGRIVAEGTPEKLAACKTSHTGACLVSEIDS